MSSSVTVESSPTQTSQVVAPARSRFVVNIGANLLNFALSVLVGFWFTPYLIRHLGVAAYGLIPLATTVTSYMSLATIALNGSVGRFLTIALERRDDAQANRIFNTSLMGNIVVVCILLLPAVWASSHADSIFNVPAGYERAFAWLFFCVIGSFFLSSLSSSFALSSYCRNRLDLSNLVEATSTVTRVGAVVVLFAIFTPQVWHIGVALLLALGLSVTGSILIFRRLTPMLHVQPRAFSTATLRQMTGMGGWMTINQIGSLLYLSIDLIVVNRLLGPEAGGRYGAVMQWSTLLRGFAGTIAGVFGPPILMLYARHDMAGLVRYSQRAVRFVGLAIALPVGLICGFSGPLLSIWLGPKFIPLAPLLSLMTIHLSVNLCIFPLFHIQSATNRVRLPGILTCVMGLMNLGLALLLAGPVGWGMYGVAAAGAIMLTTKNLIFTPWYAARLLGLPWDVFFRKTLPVIAITLGLAAASWYTANRSQPHSWLGLILAAGSVAIGYALLLFGVLLRGEERRMALGMILPYLKRSR